MPVGRSERSFSCGGERLGLLEIARARGFGEENATLLPAGRRDASGFWFPAGYRDPMDLFTPHQRSLQVKQRVLRARRGRPGPAQGSRPIDDVALPLLLADVVPADSAPVAGHGPRAHEAEPRARRPPAPSCVDSSGRSV